jgi:hypothetical protein
VFPCNHQCRAAQHRLLNSWVVQASADK